MYLCIQSEDEVSYLRHRLRILETIKNEDTKYFMTALNLSGQREYLENKAFDLIQEKGLLGALRYSRGGANE